MGRKRPKGKARGAEMPPEWVARFALAIRMAEELGMSIKTLAPLTHKRFNSISFDSLKRVLKGQRSSAFYREILDAVSSVIAAKLECGTDKERQSQILSQFMEGNAESVIQSKTNDVLVQLERLETPIRAADLGRLHPGLDHFLRQELRESPPPLFHRKPEMMIKPLLGGRDPLQISIPVVVLTRAGKITLNTKPPSLEEDESNPKAALDEYVIRLKAINDLKHQDTTDGKYLYNNPTYTLKDLKVDKYDTECTLMGGLSDYFTILSTHIAAEFELLSAAASLSTYKKLPHNFSDLLSKRAALKKGNTAPFISLSALMVYKVLRGDQYKVLILKRAQGIPVYPGLFAVIPGGMFQPEFLNDNEWNICHCLIKEYTEELFDKHINKKTPGPFYIYKEWKQAKSLYDALNNGACKLLHSGITFNLFNLGVEVCCVLLIEDASWLENQEGRSTNFEYMSLQDIVSTDRNARIEYDFHAVEEQFRTYAIGSNVNTPVASSWVPASLAAFWLGIEALKEHLDPQTSSRRPNRFVPFL